MDPASACLDAAATAEHDWMVPPNLIAAIGRVESGRPDRTTKRVAPWPWTVNANGSGSYFATRTEAIEFVRALQSRGIWLIDVGCFQVDLQYHPTAFATLEDAFDPGANANYAARFLTTLHAQTGNWPAAVARYHSGLAHDGEVYWQQVVGQWRSPQALIQISDSPATEQSPLRRAATSHAQDQDPFVIVMSPTARAIHIFGPSIAGK